MQQLKPQREPGNGAQHDWEGICGIAQRWFEREPAVGACQSTREHDVEVSRYVLTVADGYQVNVFAKAAVRKVGAGKGGAADEMDTASEVSAEKCQ